MRSLIGFPWEEKPCHNFLGTVAAVGGWQGGLVRDTIKPLNENGRRAIIQYDLDVEQASEKTKIKAVGQTVKGVGIYEAKPGKQGTSG